MKKNYNISYSISSVTLFLATLALSIYYLLYVISFILIASPNSQIKKIAWLLTPFDRIHTLLWLKGKNDQLSNQELKLLNIFNQKDPEIQEAIIQLLENQNTQDSTTLLYYKIISLDSKNIDYQKKYILSLSHDSNVNEFIYGLLYASRKYLPDKFNYSVENIDIIPKEYYLNKTRQLLDINSTVTEFDYYLAKIYYYVGLDLLELNPKLTEIFWTIARDLNPWLSFYSAELASLYKYKFDDYSAASRVLEKCEEFSSAKNHCHKLKGIGANGLQLLPLGFFEMPIRDYP